MIPVSQALEQLFALVRPPAHERLALTECAGRVLVAPLVAGRDQPPFAAAAMDGYALRSAEAEEHAQFSVIGEAAAGHRFDGEVKPGQAVRIFTGAPMPCGTDRVVIQEDTERQGTLMTITSPPGASAHLRARGSDFERGAELSAPRLLTPQTIALMASMNAASVQVARKPRVTILSTGDELVWPGAVPGPDQIVASNTFGLAAMVHQAGGLPQIAPLVPDQLPALCKALEAASSSDLIITIGGASVGDHDLVARALDTLGAKRAFYKVAMRPGKPLMAGRLGDAILLGLPGNPVSAMVCGEVFLKPLIAAMLGLPARPAARQRAALAAPLPANGPREHYMRARLTPGGLIAAERQDSALLGVLAEATALIVRPPHDPARRTGEELAYLPI